MSSLKKLHAFTLAEVLVTLMIIGVIAAMTIPGLRRSSEEKENITAMKKAYSTLSQLVALSEQENGPLRRWAMPVGDHTGIYKNYLKDHLNIARDCGISSDKACSGDPVLMANQVASGWSSFYKIILADGTRWAIEASGNEHAHIYVDVNGNKKPNILGVDAFMYTITKSAFVDYAHNVPEAGVYYFGQGISRASLLSNCTSNGYTCGALIVLDGDKIKY